jgi:hypothetical protein
MFTGVSYDFVRSVWYGACVTMPSTDQTNIENDLHSVDHPQHGGIPFLFGCSENGDWSKYMILI